MQYDLYNAHAGGYGGNMRALCAHFGIDLKKLERDAAKEFGKRKRPASADKK